MIIVLLIIAQIFKKLHLSEDNKENQETMGGIDNKHTHIHTLLVASLDKRPK